MFQSVSQSKMGKCNGVTEKIKEKMFNDPIHGHIRLSGECLKVLDTPQFQRMRHIKQLAAVWYVYPGATHDRLSHMLGTCHLSRVVLDHLKREQPELEIERHEVEAVTLAALCHDVGHGPFSHVLDNEIIPAITGASKWHHEERGVAVMDHLIDENCLDIDKDIVRMAQDLILSKLPEKNTKKYERRFLWDIVANERTSVDVDKFDYLARDSKWCGVPTSFDHHRIINMMRVVDGEICFNATEAEAVYELFAMRAKMHRTVYQHKCVKAIEYMIVDALKAANDFFHLKESLRPGNIRAFCKLDDTILRNIVNLEDDQLRSAQAIVNRIETRDLYKYVNDFAVPAKEIRTFGTVRPDDILKYALTGADHVNLKADDIIVHNMKIDYGKDLDNPVNYVGFFDKHRPYEKFNIEAQKISVMLPQDYKDLTIRVYSRTRDKPTVDAIRLASECYQEEVLGCIVQRTPHKRQRANDAPPEDNDKEANIKGRAVRNLGDQF